MRIPASSRQNSANEGNACEMCLNFLIFSKRSDLSFALTRRMEKHENSRLRSRRGKSLRWTQALPNAVVRAAETLNKKLAIIDLVGNALAAFAKY